MRAPLPMKIDPVLLEGLISSRVLGERAIDEPYRVVAEIVGLESVNQWNVLIWPTRAEPTSVRYFRSRI